MPHEITAKYSIGDTVRNIYTGKEMKVRMLMIDPGGVFYSCGCYEGSEFVQRRFYEFGVEGVENRTEIGFKKKGGE